MKTITINGHVYKHGDSVTCVIQDVVITDAKISIPKDDIGKFHICQNLRNGDICPDLLGYTKSWVVINNNLTVANMKDLRPLVNETVINNYQIY